MMHVMVDLETLGTRPGSVILSIGAVQFSDAGLGAEFYRVIDVFDSLMAGLVVDPETVGWWRQQSPEAKGAIGDPHVRWRLGEALRDFAKFVDRAPQAYPIWAKGPDFDLVLLESAFLAAGIRKPWNFRDARDVRTILSLKPDIPLVRAGHKHNALDDAQYQAAQVMAVYQDLGLKLGEPE